ncbi:hypothetical protein [Clostridium sp.]|uniref:hypothetical protein n=1 Tax=Clostridium sp. TaxID=1506 RepID=UPI002FC9FF84
MKKNILCILLATSVSIGAMVLAGEKNGVKDNGSIEKHAQVTQGTRMSRGGTFDDNMLSNSTNNENIKLIQGEESSETTTIKSEEESIEVESEPAPKQEEQREVEALDWWSEAQYVFPRGMVAQVEDVYTGRVFNIKRTFGTNHADCEALNKEDTEVIKEIWGGFSWERRPIIVNIAGRRIAASMAAMPHAGRDSAPALAVAKNLSAGYGTGQNLDVVKDNGMDGVFDVHFLGSKRHKDGKVQAVVDPQHQQAVEIASEAK